MMTFLVVVDMQNDFISGALRTPEAGIIVPRIAKRIEKAQKYMDIIYATLDTHQKDTYMTSMEGRKLPVEHCIEGTEGWDLDPDIKAALNKGLYTLITKPTFGSFKLVEYMQDRLKELGEPDCEMTIELCGLVSSICVLSNAVLLRAAFPNATIKVDRELVRGLNSDNNEAALEILTSQQIDVVKGEWRND